MQCYEGRVQFVKVSIKLRLNSLLRKPQANLKIIPIIDGKKLLKIKKFFLPFS